MRGRKLISALGAALLLLSLASCGQPNEDDTAAVHAALDRLNSCTSITITQVTAREESITDDSGTHVYGSVTEMDISLITAPALQMKTSTLVDLSYNGDTIEQSSTSYIVPENDGYTEYYHDGTAWYKVTTEDDGALPEISIAGTVNLYVTDDMTFRKAGTDTLEGGTATRYESRLKGAQLVSMLESNGHLSNIASMSENQQQKIRENLEKDLDALTVTVWLDKATGYPVRFELKLSSTLSDIEKSIASTLGDKEPTNQWVVSLYDMSMTLRDFDTLESFTIPTEAANAIPYETDTSVN